MGLEFIVYVSASGNFLFYYQITISFFLQNWQKWVICRLIYGYHCNLLVLHYDSDLFIFNFFDWNSTNKDREQFVRIRSLRMWFSSLFMRLQEAICLSKLHSFCRIGLNEWFCGVELMLLWFVNFWLFFDLLIFTFFLLEFYIQRSGGIYKNFRSGRMLFDSFFVCLQEAIFIKSSFFLQTYMSDLWFKCVGDMKLK